VITQARSPFKPLAEKVRDFQYKTPPRFKSRPSRAATSKKRSPITRAEVRPRQGPADCACTHHLFVAAVGLCAALLACWC
jgi:hypothetical protein